jgi:3-oxoadipate enol-lactonase
VAANGSRNVIVAGDVRGAKPPIIFVNSLAATGEMWNGVVSELGERIGTIRYDQRDRFAPFGGALFSLDDLVDDLFAVLDDAGVSEAQVAGVSLGGIVGLRAAAREPKRVSTLTVMCCSARFDQESWISRARTVRQHGVASLTDQVMKRWFTEAWLEQNPEQLEQMRRMFSETSTYGYALACDVLANADVRKELASITPPSLIISGEHDRANPIADQRFIAEQVPGATHEIIAGAAHLAPVSNAAEVAALLRRHIDLGESSPSRSALRP